MPVRHAEPERDAAACVAIYAPYVAHTAVSFEEVVPTTAQFATRIAETSARYPWLVLEDDGRVTGYAYGGPFKERAAYRYACEVSVYLEHGLRRSGGGRALYSALLARLAERGYRTAAAVIALPNDASVALHSALGFTPVGTFRRIGWKHDRWHDVAWMQRDLGVGDTTRSSSAPSATMN